jgi:hypothetical protein
MVRFCFVTLLLILPALARSEGAPDAEQKELEEVLVQGAAPEEPGDDLPNWVDDSHAYATDRAQELSEWMDGFFGDPVYDVESPESLVRIGWVNTLDEEEDYKSKGRIRGKIQLPRLSERLNLVFIGEEGDALSNEEDIEGEDRVGLQYTVGERKRSRVDLTMGISWGSLRPGIRFRNQGPITEGYRYRYTQRLQYEDDEGFYTTGQLNLDHDLEEDRLLRWSNRVVYGEETDGAEWRSKLSLRQRLKPLGKKHQSVLSYFASVKGQTDPSFVKNTRFGILWRRQVYRQFLFMELEPSYNFRKREDEDRSGVWNIVLRFEIALHRDLRRKPLVTLDQEASANSELP